MELERQSLITKEQESKISDLQKDLEHGFSCLRMFRSEFLMRNSVLAMNPTMDGKYWQAILERDVHFRELINLQFAYREKLADIEIADAEWNKLNAEIYDACGFNKEIMKAKLKKAGIQIERERSMLMQYRKEASERIREITTWTKIIAELKPHLKYSPDNPEEYQAEEWASVYADRMALIKQIGASDMNGAINTFMVGSTVLNDPAVIRLAEERLKSKNEQH